MNFGPEPGTSGAATPTEYWGRIAIGLLLLFAALTLAFASYLGIMKPDSEAAGTWFARSGALITVLSIFSEHVLSGVIPRLNKSIQIHVRKLVWCRRVAFFAIIIGTIIWGYGDLLI